MRFPFIITEVTLTEWNFSWKQILTKERKKSNLSNDLWITELCPSFIFPGDFQENGIGKSDENYQNCYVVSKEKPAVNLHSAKNLLLGVWSPCAFVFGEPQLRMLLENDHIFPLLFKMQHRSMWKWDKVILVTLVSFLTTLWNIKQNHSHICLS
jgi:hypothetical protein